MEQRASIEPSSGYGCVYPFLVGQVVASCRASFDESCFYPLCYVPDFARVCIFRFFPDETPPALGGMLAESAEERVARRAGKSPDITWSTDVTYTMAFQRYCASQYSGIAIPQRGPK